MLTTNPKTYYIDQPVVFFPGLLCDERLFTSSWQYLDIPKRAFVPLSWAENLAQMKMLSTDRLAYFEQPVHLVGFSMGGYIAALTAIENKHRIASLTLIGSACDALPQDELKQRKHLLNLIKSKRYMGMSKQRLLSFFHSLNQHNDGYLDTVKQMEKDLGPAVLAAQVTATESRRSLLKDLAVCTFPIHLLGGEQDNLVPESTCLAMHQQLPTSDLKIFAQAGHMLPIEQPLSMAEYLAQKIG